MIIPMPQARGTPVGNDVQAVAPPDPLLRLWREATALSREGRHGDAEGVWRNVVAAAPQDADAAYQLGLTRVALGRHEDAVASFERAVHYAPDNQAARLALGRALLACDRAKNAQHVFEDLIAAEPNQADALAGRAASLIRLAKADEALASLERVTAHQPDHAEALFQKARAMADLKRDDDDIIALLNRICTLDPDHVEAAKMIARLLQPKLRHTEAVLHLRRVVALRPTDALAWQDLGSALRNARQYGESRQAFRRALALKPAFATAYANLAMLLNDSGKSDEALDAIGKALAIEPDSRTARFIKGCIHLTRGEFEAGWDDYECRFNMDKGNKGAREDLTAEPWCGEPLQGRSMMVLGEQASGDYIQFSANLPLLLKLGADVSFFVPKRLKRLLGSIDPSIRVMDGLAGGVYDYQIHLMSLPQRLLRLGHGTAPSPWLHAEPELLRKWRSYIGENGFRIAVAWRGSNNDYRSFDPTYLAALASIPSVRLISLHMEGPETDPKGYPDGLAIERLGADYDAGEDGFVDAAAVMEAVDLVITCDTSLAHLAGALARPVWIALAHAPEWRWQKETTRSVWYPTARLFRQPAPNDWDSVFQSIAEALREKLEHGQEKCAAVFRKDHAQTTP